MMRKTKIFLDNFGLLTETSAFEVRPRNTLLFLRLFMIEELKKLIMNSATMPICRMFT